MMIIIFLSTIIITLQNPTYDKNSSFQKFLEKIHRIVESIYIIEFILNIIAYGFFFGRFSYLKRSNWNIFDFLILLSIFYEISFPDSNFTGIGIIRGFRVLKLAQKNEGVKILLESIIQVFPNFIKLIIFTIVIFLCFGVFLMKYLKGSFFHCVGLTFLDTKFFIENIISRENCFDFGGDWINKDNNFDNILNSVGSLFEIATSEGWLYIV